MGWGRVIELPGWWLGAMQPQGMRNGRREDGEVNTYLIYTYIPPTALASELGSFGGGFAGWLSIHPFLSCWWVSTDCAARYPSVPFVKRGL
jgi:hypothetical protein